MRYKERVEALIKELKAFNLDGVLISSSPNVFYLTGFTSTNAHLVITPSECIMLTDGRYFEKAQKQVSGWDIRLIDKGFEESFSSVIKELKIKKLGYEKHRITYEFFELISKIVETPIGVKNLVEKLRLKKDKEEFEIIKQAVELTEEVYEKIKDYIKKNISKKEITELEIRGVCVFEMFKAGASGESFPAIVATSKHSSIPHWETSKSLIKLNAPLLIDMGLKLNGYCSDFTRTLYIGEKPDKEFLRLYQILKDSWFFGFEAVKPGMAVKELDLKIREYLKKKDVEKLFIHATGHGVGIEIHEIPHISYKAKEDICFEEGMVFTIEPGLYLPGKFGIRLENIIAIHNGKPEILGKKSLELEIIEV